MRKINIALTLLVGACLLSLSACGYRAAQTADSQIATQQEKHLEEGAAEVPPANIVNWNEKRQLKRVLEARDQVNLSTWTYTKNMDGKYTFVCESIGYGIPYATQSTNPQHYTWVSTPSRYSTSGSYSDGNGNYFVGEYAMMPQAEPNGLFIPSDSRGTWNMCRDPNTGKPVPTYQEEDVSVFPYKLPAGMVEGFHPQPLEKMTVEEVHAAYNGDAASKTTK